LNPTSVGAAPSLASSSYFYTEERYREEKLNLLLRLKYSKIELKLTVTVLLMTLRKLVQNGI
jgi:hypothetical protein